MARPLKAEQLKAKKNAPVKFLHSIGARPTRHGDDKPGLARSGRRAGSVFHTHGIRWGCVAKVPGDICAFAGNPQDWPAGGQKGVKSVGSWQIFTVGCGIFTRRGPTTPSFSVARHRSRPICIKVSTKNARVDSAASAVVPMGLESMSNLTPSTRLMNPMATNSGGNGAATPARR